MPAKSTEKALALATRVREARDRAGFNNTTLADAAGLERKTIRRLARGENYASQATIEKIAKATRQPLSFFVVDDEVRRLTEERERIVEALLPFAQLVTDLVAEARDPADKTEVAA